MWSETAVSRSFPASLSVFSAGAAPLASAATSLCTAASDAFVRDRSSSRGASSDAHAATAGTRSSKKCASSSSVRASVTTDADAADGASRGASAAHDRSCSSAATSAGGRRGAKKSAARSSSSSFLSFPASNEALGSVFSTTPPTPRPPRTRRRRRRFCDGFRDVRPPPPASIAARAVLQRLPRGALERRGVVEREVVGFFREVVRAPSRRPFLRSLALGGGFLPGEERLRGGHLDAAVGAEASGRHLDAAGDGAEDGRAGRDAQGHGRAPLHGGADVASHRDDFFVDFFVGGGGDFGRALGGSAPAVRPRGEDVDRDFARVHEGGEGAEAREEALVVAVEEIDRERAVSAVVGGVATVGTVGRGVPIRGARGRASGARGAVVGVVPQAPIAEAEDAAGAGSRERVRGLERVGRRRVAAGDVPIVLAGDVTIFIGADDDRREETAPRKRRGGEEGVGEAKDGRRRDRVRGGDDARPEREARERALADGARVSSAVKRSANRGGSFIPRLKC